MKKLIKPPYRQSKIVGIVVGVLVSAVLLGVLNRNWIVDEGSVKLANLTAGRQLKSTYSSEFGEIEKLFLETGVSIGIKQSINDTNEPCKYSNFNKFRGTVDCGIGKQVVLATEDKLIDDWQKKAPEIENFLVNNGWERQTYGSYGSPPTLIESISTEFWASTSYYKKTGNDVSCSLSTASKLNYNTFTVNISCSKSVEYFGGFVKGSVWQL